MAKGTFWVVVQAKRNQYRRSIPGDHSSPYAVDEIKPKAISVNKPTSVEKDQEAIEVTIEFPDGYFDTNAPKVEIKVPQVKNTAPIPVTAKVKARSQSAAAATIFANQVGP